MKTEITGKIYDPVLDCGHVAMDIKEVKDDDVRRMIADDLQTELLFFEGKLVKLTIEEI